MSRIIKYTLLAAMTLSLVSCGDGFFDLEPSNSVTRGKLYKTADDFNMAVIGCYGRLQGQISNLYFECCEYRSDNIYLSAPTAGTQDRYDIDQFADRPSNGILTDLWANFNNGVYRCNLVLDQIDEATFDEALRDQYKAEAMFIRAYTYFNMYRLWGGVPTTRRSVSVAEALKIGRSTVEEMYDLIAGDLQYIVDNQMLPESYSGDDLGRITIGAARALLGKVYLTFGRYTEARDALAGVIGKNSLMNTPYEVFDVNNKMNNEIIFAIRFNKEVPGEGHGFWFTGTGLGNPDNQTASLKECYDPSDLRKELIETEQAESNVFVIKKYYDTRNATTNNVGNDFIVLRYADVLLMYAEALNEIGYSASQTSDAMKALNEVHTRAGLPELQISDLSSQDLFRRAICKERQMEFPYEGHRWFDLVRMGYAKEAMLADGHVIEDYQMLYPIPQTEIERLNNESLLWQNPGY